MNRRTTNVGHMDTLADLLAAKDQAYSDYIAAKNDYDDKMLEDLTKSDVDRYVAELTAFRDSFKIAELSLSGHENVAIENADAFMQAEGLEQPDCPIVWSEAALVWDGGSRNSILNGLFFASYPEGEDGYPETRYTHMETGRTFYPGSGSGVFLDWTECVPIERKFVERVRLDSEYDDAVASEFRDAVARAMGRGLYG